MTLRPLLRYVRSNNMSNISVIALRVEIRKMQTTKMYRMNVVMTTRWEYTIVKLLINFDVSGYFYCNDLCIFCSVLLISTKSEPSKHDLLYSTKVSRTKTH